MGHWTEIGLNDSLRALQGACLLLAGLLPLHPQERKKTWFVSDSIPRQKTIPGQPAQTSAFRGDLNRSTQHLISISEEGDVDDDLPNEDQLYCR